MTRMVELRRIVREHGWWLGATALVTTALVVTLGWWLLPAYTGINAAGTTLYLDGLRGRDTRVRRLVVPLAAVALVPVGLLMLARPTGLAPSERATSASSSDDLRRGTAGIQMGATHGPGGRTGAGS